MHPPVKYDPPYSGCARLPPRDRNALLHKNWYPPTEKYTLQLKPPPSSEKSPSSKILTVLLTLSTPHINLRWHAPAFEHPVRLEVRTHKDLHVCSYRSRGHFRDFRFVISAKISEFHEIFLKCCTRFQDSFEPLGSHAWFQAAL